MFVRTSYDTGPYRIVSILRGCTCPEYLDTINMTDPPPSRPHIHMTVEKPGDTPRNSPYYLGGYDEETLESVWTKYTTPESCIPYDRLYVVSPRKIFKQMFLFPMEAR
jgi:hypothetical protein